MAVTLFNERAHKLFKGYSHRCIEVKTKIFKHLREYYLSSKKKTIIPQVKYVVGQNTHGGTTILHTAEENARTISIGYHFSKAVSVDEMI